MTNILGIELIDEKSVQGGDSKVVAVHPIFVWPDLLPYLSL